MGPGEFLNINVFTALFTLANTVLLFAVLRHYLFQPVMTILAARQQEVRDRYAAADTAREIAAALEAEYRQKLSAASEEGQRILQEAVAREKRREEEILLQAQMEADALLRRAQQRIAQEEQRAVSDSKEEICVIAISLAEKVLARQLGHKEQQRLLDDFIEELEELP